MADYDYDLLVIGAGPAGEAAAMAATKSEMTVGVIDAQSDLGGNCTHKGTIPSKALRHVVKQVINYRKQPEMLHLNSFNTITYPAVLQAAKSIIPRKVAMHKAYFMRNRIHVHSGLAHFTSANSVAVEYQDSPTDNITAKHILIATGSRPYRPSNIDFNHPRIYDSDTILRMAHTPRTLVIYGAGVIGCEYASIFSGLGIKVCLLYTSDAADE